MPTMRVMDSFLLKDVHLITAWRDGCIYRTKSVGIFHRDSVKHLSPDKYVLCSVSTKLMKPGSPPIEYKMWED
jgi:hypothetical protein